MNKLKTIYKDPFERKILFTKIKNIVLKLGRILILSGVSFCILSPIISMVVSSVASTEDIYNPMMFILPKQPTLEKYRLCLLRLDYFKTLGNDLLYTLSLTVIQLFICSMVGYGFARFNFRFKKLLFSLVIVMIVIPSYTIMLPLYMSFRNFDPFSLVSMINGEPLNFMGSVKPMYIMTALGCGVRSGLYIYIFTQFFRGLPKEIEEAAFVDGAGVWYTYFRIMLANALPAVVTVTVFSIVWQFNDTFYAKLFLIGNDVVISKRISSLASVLANQDKILNVTLQEQYTNAGIILAILPIVIIYLLLQKSFIEGVERSGIVG